MLQQASKIALGLGLALALTLPLALTGCATATRTPAPSVPVTCADFSFPIYFATNSEQLTVAAQQIIAESAARVRGCKLGEIMVMGLADADGGTGSLAATPIPAKLGLGAGNWPVPRPFDSG